MPIFKKEDEVLDITELQRRGIVKKENPSENVQTDYAELQAPQDTSSSNPLGFLDTFAAAATAEPQGLPAPPSHDPTDLVDLKVKLEDFEYKLERFTEKIAIIESKLEEFENKGV